MALISSDFRLTDKCLRLYFMENANSNCSSTLGDSVNLYLTWYKVAVATRTNRAAKRKLKWEIDLSDPHLKAFLEITWSIWFQLLVYSTTHHLWCSTNLHVSSIESPIHFFRLNFLSIVLSHFQGPHKSRMMACKFPKKLLKVWKIDRWAAIENFNRID